MKLQSCGSLHYQSRKQGQIQGHHENGFFDMERAPPKTMYHNANELYYHYPRYAHGSEWNRTRPDPLNISYLSTFGYTPLSVK